MPKIPPLSTTEASSETGIPRRTIIAAINRGDLRANKLTGLTGAFLIERRDLDRWLAKRGSKASA
ncbi:helix-turn-helix domain-containing protein [Mycolicibacterium farcinogenes]|nr:helix-turn-helix domain-containing protein [Mycolicibacterium farcinogenes]